MYNFLNPFIKAAPIAFKFGIAIAISIGFLNNGAVAASNSKQASIVIDANTGKTLHANNADAPRHPASLTKMMTLYMVFDALEKGKISKNSKIIMSKHAASMPPTKLGIKAGNSITVETAIYALVTKSANDAAAATAEFLGGSESNFAQMMTAKAKSIGMRNSRFYNASGLPDVRQITTARDMAILGMALRTNFPQYYSYFATRSFTYGRSRMNNHNKLLGRIKGVDGIKTGYTRMSGFNLVSSVSLGGKRVVSVVLGGKSGRSRDAEMAGLLSKYVPKASNKATGNALAAMRNIFKDKDLQGSANDQVALNAVDVVIPVEKPEELALDQTPSAEDSAPEIGTQAKELALASLVKPAKRPIVPITEEVETNVSGVDDTQTEQASVDPITTASAPAQEEGKNQDADLANGAWVIQVAAAESEDGAMKLLDEAKAKGGKALAAAKPFTQSVKKGSIMLYRARFGGFDSKDDAWNACAALKKKNYGCFALDN